MIYEEVDSSTRRTISQTTRVLGTLKLDGPLVLGLALLAVYGQVVLYSASGQDWPSVLRGCIRIGLGATAMLALAQVKPGFLRRLTPFLYTIGVVLLIVVDAIGYVGKGAQRWLDLGVVRFQPSEIMKLAVPMMCAWYLRERPLPPEVRERQKRAEGGPEVSATWSDGRVRGAHRGREFALEALERFAVPDDTLDLHGLEPVTAKLRVGEFVRTRRARGMRCVSVITGYGKNSPDGASVLLDAVVEALRVSPAASEIDAFASAPDDLGGRGAILISLRH